MTARRSVVARRRQGVRHSRAARLRTVVSRRDVDLRMTRATGTRATAAMKTVVAVITDGASVVATDIAPPKRVLRMSVQDLH